MELQIQDLLSSIRTEGIEKASQEADGILADARKQAEEILAQANDEAAALRDAAEKDVARFRENAQLGAEQARRDAMLAFKAAVQAEFERLLTQDVGKALDDKALATLIAAALNGENPADYAAEVHTVSDGLKQQLAQQLKAGLEIRPAKSVRAGFRLAAKDGSGFFDCTDEEISKILMPFFRDIQL